MQVIRDYKKLKELIPSKYQHCCVGFSRGAHLFNDTHEHIFKYSIGKAQKLFGIVWDNKYDSHYFNNKALGAEPPDPITTITEFNEEKVIEWFKQKGFNNLFLPDRSFISEITKPSLFNIISSKIDEIWEKERYDNLLCESVPFGDKNWIKLVLYRGYLLYSNISGSKFINRTYQTTAPDGTFGYIYKNFWEKYCDCKCDIVPILRNENGTPFDIFTLKYPQEVIDLFVSFTPAFNKFRQELKIFNLKNSIKDLVSESKFNMGEFKQFNTDMTFNKDVFYISILDENIKYRMWEYGNGI